MSQTIDKIKEILESRQTLKKVLRKQLNIQRKTHRRLESLISTSERKKYHYRPELEVINDWVRKQISSLAKQTTENNKKIHIAQELVEIERLSQLLEIVERNNLDW